MQVKCEGFRFSTTADEARLYLEIFTEKGPELYNLWILLKILLTVEVQILQNMVAAGYIDKDKRKLRVVIWHLNFTGCL